MNLTSELGLSSEQARLAFGAARAVAEADGAPGPRATRLLEVLASSLGLGDWTSIARATPNELAAALSDPAARRILCDALVVPASIEGDVTARGEAVVQGFAEALDVRSPWVGLLPAIRQRRVLTIKRALFAGSPDGKRILSRTWAEDGVAGLFHALSFVLCLHRDAPLSARFRSLRDLPEGSLGRSFHDDFVSRGLNFPGERGGLPERMIHHDLMHVVNGYGTEPAGECELGGFYAGFCSRFGFGDWFTFIVTVLTTFHLGLPVSPSIVTPAVHAFDPERVLAAFSRGRRLAVDVMGPWDYWSLMPLPMLEVRRRLGIGELDPRSADAVTP